MQNSFVPPLDEDLAREDPETYQINARYRTLKIQNISKQQFQMVYYGKFTWEDTENMSLSEREMVYQLLYQQKKEEKENYEKQVQDAKQKNNKSSRPVKKTGRR